MAAWDGDENTRYPMANENEEVCGIKGASPHKDRHYIGVIGLGVGWRGDGRGVRVKSRVSGTSGLCSGESQ
jgi:hypothetical protein